MAKVLINTHSKNHNVQEQYLNYSEHWNPSTNSRTSGTAARKKLMAMSGLLNASSSFMIQEHNRLNNAMIPIFNIAVWPK